MVWYLWTKNPPKTRKMREAKERGKFIFDRSMYRDDTKACAKFFPNYSAEEELLTQTTYETELHG